MTSAPGDPSTLYVVEQTGKVVMVRGGKIAGTFLDISDRVGVGEELGLLGIAFHPGYAQNHLFYVDYTDHQGDTHVAELSAPNGIADPASARDLLVVDQPYPNHKGGQLAFDARGLLYVGPRRRRDEPRERRHVDRRPREPRAEPGQHARQAAAHRPAAGRRRLGDGRDGPAQPVALLVRPGDREPLDRRRRRCDVRGDRLPSAGEDRRARELRLEPITRARRRTTRRSRSPTRPGSCSRSSRTGTSAGAAA